MVHMLANLRRSNRILLMRNVINCIVGGTVTSARLYFKYCNGVQTWSHCRVLVFGDVWTRLVVTKSGASTKGLTTISGVDHQLAGEVWSELS